MQKEDLQNQFRNLKITNNITKEENIKLKTKVQQVQQELNQRDKELEKLTIKLQQTLQAPNVGTDSKSSHHFTESFIVSQLKKNNRDLKQEVLDKDKLIEQLKRNIKLTKSQEIEVELTVYIDECLRLRGQLEQVSMEKNMLAQQQEMSAAQGGNPQRNYEEIANLEEAFRYQEMELQKEREQNQQIRMQFMKVSETNSKLKDK